jgi:hypothetical protein
MLTSSAAALILLPAVLATFRPRFLGRSRRSSAPAGSETAPARQAGGVG